MKQTSVFTRFHLHPALGAVLSVALLLAAPLAAQEASPPQVQAEVPIPAAPLPDAAPGLPLPDSATVTPSPTPPALTPSPQAPGAAAPAIPPTAAPAPDTPAPFEATGLPHDLSPMGMFRAAHWVVQAVMLSLLAACFLTWTVLLFKLVELFAAGRRLRRSGRIIRNGAALPAVAEALSQRRDPAAIMAQAAHEEMRRSDPALDQAGSGGVKERVHSLLERIEVQAGKRLRRGTGVLATIGATAPFVGLFGTVWGIMNSFIGIAETRSTNLAVVAPGIAEALLATAIGLVAAIPAVMIYNHFSRLIGSYRLTLGDAGAAVERLVSRDLDFRTAGRGV